MIKLIYAIVQENKFGKTKFISFGNTEEYTRYTSYLVALSRHFGVETSQQFDQFYYSFYLNPEWKNNEQYCTRNLPANRANWLDSNLTAKLDQGVLIKTPPLSFTAGNSYINSPNINNYYNNDFDHVNFKANPDCLTFLARVKIIVNHLNSDAYYQLTEIIKPNKIWREQGQFNTWINIVNKNSYIPDLYTFDWKNLSQIGNISFSGRIGVSCPKGHFRHLVKAYTPRNYDIQIKDEYNLTCKPKHMHRRHPQNITDIHEMRNAKQWHRHESWKNHKFRHQYEQHAIQNNRLSI